MYKAALIGLPNAGKTTVYNALTGKNERTGNWHGVTVDSRSAKLKNSEVIIYDLPGIYGLNAFSPEEKVSENFIKINPESLFLNIIPTADLARGIKTAVELIKRGLKTAVVLTFYDEYVKRGGKLDLVKLSKLINAPVIAINANKRKDAARLARFVETTAKTLKLMPTANFAPNRPENQRTQSAPTPLNQAKYSNTYAQAEQSAQESEQEFYNKLGQIFTAPKYREQAIDKLLLNKFWCALSFILVTAAVFFLTFGKNSIGDLMVRGIDSGMDALSAALRNTMQAAACPSVVIGLVTDGILGGVGGVLCFLPQLALLYLFLTLLEESGYMARIAFMFDGFFRKIGLNGRAVFSVFMGFGCTAMAALSTRALDNSSMQKKTVLSLPFITCSARLPIYLVLCNTFFARNKVLILIGIYIFGIIAAAITASLLNKYFYKIKQTFIMEMPDMRLPDIKKLLKVLIYYLKQFIIRIGSTIIIVITVLWLLKSFSFRLEFLSAAEIENSMLAALGKGLKYLLYPMGITDWRVSVSVITGIFAKEAVVGTLELLCPTGLIGVITPISGLAFIVFCTLYTPCLSALAAMRREIGVKLTIISAISSFIIALAAGYLTYFLSLIGGLINIKTVLICVAAAAVLYAAFKGLRAKKCGNCAKCAEANERNNCPKKDKTRKTAQR